MSVIISGAGIIVPDGTAASPAYEGSDADSGIYFPAAGAVAFSSDGVERFRLSGSSLSMTGTLTVSSNITAFSDVRLKANIHPLQNSLEKVKQIQGVSYHRKDDGQKKIGFIAQNLQKVVPEVVIENDGGILSVDYGNVVALLTEAIKEQQLLIESLKNRLDVLENK